MIGIDVIITATTAVMTDVTTTVMITATIGVTGVIVVMIAIMIVTTTDEMTDVMIDVVRTTTERSGRHHHRPKGTTPMVHSRRLTARSTSSSQVAKRSEATDRLDQMLGRSGTSTPKTHDLCSGLNSQALSPGKIIGFTSLTPEPIRWSLTP
jgi:hypothetical protein